jgi:hypothetical protein
VLSRADTRALTRDWMLEHVPPGAKIVAEPVSPDNWAAAVPGEPGCAASPGYRWCKYPSLVSRIDPTGAVTSTERVVGIEDYVRTLSPALIGYYLQHGYCWVVSGTTQAGRALADPSAAPLAAAYYAQLSRVGTVEFRASPYSAGSGPVPFGFDWSFDYYPLAYHRPGPAITVYRLHGGRCGP